MPKTTYRAGDTYYVAVVNENGTARLDVWVLRTIRAGRGYLIRKEPFIYNNGIWSHNIPDWCRRSFSLEPVTDYEEFPEEFQKTRAEAIAYAIRETTERLSGDPDPEAVAFLEKGLSSLNNLLTTILRGRKTPSDR